jgi:hypothetical protein
MKLESLLSLTTKRRIQYGGGVQLRDFEDRIFEIKCIFFY